ncbi:GNAT family N-acetyltransferase [candidate division WOR-3 bacterium]|nr:GNAT family N-acetyltransferase [candidate division WOR-3 bacterium]
MLTDFPKEVKLKTGDTVILRPMVKEDEQRLLDFFKRLPEKDRLYLKHDVTDPAIMHGWVENINYEHVTPIIAEKGDQIIGDATLHLKTIQDPHSIGEIRIVTDKDFRRIGLGTRLAREIYFLALSRKMNRLVAEVVEDQEHVIEAFTQLGFRPDKVLKDKAVDLHGKKHNLVIMAADIDDLWTTIKEQLDEDTGRGSRS